MKNRDAIPGHPLRQRLIEAIGCRPGLRLYELWKGLNANRQTLKYHLTVLEKAHLVSSLKLENATRYFPAHISALDRMLLAVLLRGRVLEMALMIEANPGVRQADLANALRMSRKTLRGYANNLLRHGVITEVCEPHCCRYFSRRSLAGIISAPPLDSDKKPGEILPSQRHRESGTATIPGFG